MIIGSPLSPPAGCDKADAAGHHLVTSQLRTSLEGRTTRITEKWNQRPDYPLSGAYMTRLPLTETHQAFSCLSHCGRGVVLIFATQSTPISINANGATISTEEWDLLLYLSAFCHRAECWRSGRRYGQHPDL